MREMKDRVYRNIDPMEIYCYLEKFLDKKYRFGRERFTYHQEVINDLIKSLIENNNNEDIIKSLLVLSLINNFSINLYEIEIETKGLKSTLILNRPDVCIVYDLEYTKEYYECALAIFDKD